MIKESKYIIRRVIIGVLIALILSFISSCDVHAETRNVFDIGSTMKQYPSNNNQTFIFNQWTTLSSGQSGYSITFNLDSNGQDHFEAGQYLFDFYIETNNLTNHLASCNGISSDFQLFDLTTNKWVSSTNQSKSACIDSYYTTIGGNRAIHYLFSWTTNNSNDALDILFTKMRFVINNFTGAGFVDFNGSYMVIMGTIQDYDPQVVQNFTNISEQQRLNQQVILNSTQNAQNIINNQNQNQAQNHQDSINEQNAINSVNDSINDSSTASNEDFNDAINSVNDALPTNSTISSLITMPITFLQKIIDALNGTCSPIVIGELYEYNMTMPCINPSDYIGFIWNIIDVICSGFFAYHFGKKLVLIFHNITSMKEGGLKEAYD